MLNYKMTVIQTLKLKIMCVNKLGKKQQESCDLSAVGAQLYKRAYR